MFKTYTQLLFVDKKAKVNVNYYVTKLLRNLIKDCKHLVLDNFIFQQDGTPAHTAALAQDWIKKKCPGFIGKKRMATEFARSQSVGLSCVGRDAGTLSEIHTKTDQHCRAEDCLAIDIEWSMICHRTSIMRHVLLQLVDMLNTRFKYQEGSWHSSLKHLNCWRKSCAKYDSLFLNIQDATAYSLKKWTLKFKLLYLLNHNCYSYKICRICGLHPHL